MIRDAGPKESLKTKNKPMLVDLRR